MKTIRGDQDIQNLALVCARSVQMIPRVKPLGVAYFNTEDVLDWKPGSNTRTLREVLIEAACRSVSIPNKYKHTWFGAVGRGLDEYIVTIWPGPAV